MHAAIPVGARRRIFGNFGSSPTLFRTLSQCLETTLMRVLLPTPPPPKSTCLMVEFQNRTNNIS